MTETEAFWGSNYYNHPDLTDEMIEIAEEILHVKLPQSYIKLLHIMNGGYTKGFAFPMSNISWSNHILLDTLNGIVIDKNIETPLSILDTEYMTKEWGLPENQVLLCGDGHTWITLDYRQHSNPSVRWIDVESNEDVFVAESFDEFLKGLVSSEIFNVD
jgi:SMI1-KNR4 cell-wall